MKIIIFGGAGFLGSHVADELTRNGHDVTIFDTKQSPYLSENQKMIIGDIQDYQQVVEAIKGNDIVYNFAAIANLDTAAKKPLDVAKINILGNVNVLEGCRLNEVKRFVFASSVYAMSNKSYFYGISKQTSERYIQAYQKKYSLPYTILRYGSLYGPRCGEENGLYRLVNQAVSNGEIVFNGTGEEVREYIHVRDASILTASIIDPKYENKRITLTGAERLRLKDILVMIKEMLDGKVEVKITGDFNESHYFVTPYQYPDELAEKMVRNPYIDIGQGLLELIKEVNDKRNP